MGLFFPWYLQCIINFKATVSMILKSILHQNDISCKRISPLKTSDIVYRELLMDSVYVYMEMCFKSALHKRRTRFTKSPYCQTLYEANSTQEFTFWLILNTKPIFPLSDLWQKGSYGATGLERPLVLPLHSKWASSLSQSPPPQPNNMEFWIRPTSLSW